MVVAYTRKSIGSFPILNIFQGQINGLIIIFYFLLLGRSVHEFITLLLYENIQSHR